jgi:hypothetical protein
VKIFDIFEGESAGQNEPRWLRIRGLIDRYPNDAGILKELIQNADDGQAGVVRIILDERKYDSLTFPHASLKKICGPAILAFNDAPFTDKDLGNLANLANSSKVEEAFKTGRFGLGFNSVYNVTDFPILLTGDKLWCLDPCEVLFADSNGGRRWALPKLTAHNGDGVLRLFEPVGYKPGGLDFEATAFRLPLRNTKHIELNQDPDRPGGVARISSQEFTPADFENLVAGLSKIAHEILLFLKNVHSVSCERISPEGHHESLLEISIANQAEAFHGREVINEVLRGRDLGQVLASCAEAEEGRIETCYSISIEVRKSEGSLETSRWQMMSGLYSGTEGKLIEASRKLEECGDRGLPHGGIALCLAACRTSKDRNRMDFFENGKARREGPDPLGRGRWRF